jgi:hypothetical protein
MEIRAYHPSHLEGIKVRDFEARELALLTGYCAQLSNLPDVYTLLVDGTVVAIGGIQMQWPGMAEGFLMTTPLVEKYPIAFQKAVTRIIHVFQKRRKLLRLQVVVHIDHAVSHRWIQRLGFGPEGLMQKYGPDGNDYVLYARVWEK